jgi:hypothetical protein
VQYFKFTADKKCRISSTNPMTFCVGDIVEANFSIVIMSVKHKDLIVFSSAALTLQRKMKKGMCNKGIRDMSV